MQCSRVATLSRTLWKPGKPLKSHYTRVLAVGQALCLYNHFYWLSELRERSEKLFATVSRERRFSLSLVGHPVTTAAEAYPHDGAADTNGAQCAHQRVGADGEVIFPAGAQGGRQRR